eukprot:3899527-Amphidinium_carterae.1
MNQGSLLMLVLPGNDYWIRALWRALRLKVFFYHVHLQVCKRDLPIIVRAQGLEDVVKFLRAHTLSAHSESQEDPLTHVRAPVPRRLFFFHADSSKSCVRKLIACNSQPQ